MSRLKQFYKMEYEKRLDMELDDLNKEFKIKTKQQRRGGRPFLKLNNNTAYFLFIVFGILLTWINIDPRPVIAVKHVVKELFMEKTDESVIIGTVSYWPQIPEGFEQEDVPNEQYTRLYKNTQEQYIKVSIYPDTYKITVDVEDCNLYEETVVNGNDAVMVVKQGITTIYIYYCGEKIIKLESNLPYENTKEVAETIN